MTTDYKIQPKVTLTEAINNLALLGKPFKSPTFWTWKVVAKLIDGIPLTEPREIALFEQCTGRSYSRFNRRAVRRLIILAGRRAGKDRFLSSVAVWRSALCQNWKAHISAGEGACSILLGADRKQASILRKYCHGLITTPLLAREVLRDTNELIEFANGSSLEIVTNNAALVRGRSAIGVFGSECCQWKSDENNSSSDEEVVSAAEPSLSMCRDVPGGILCLGSSVFRKRGFMYRKYRELFGNDDADDICWFAPSMVMNPALPRSVIDRALAENPNKAGAEYENRWREDSSDYVPPDILEACTDGGEYERMPRPNIHYVAYCDSAGGLGSDSFTLAIAHAEDDKVVLDLLREKKPRFVPRAVVKEFANILKAYKVLEVHSDGFAGGFHQAEWTENGIQFKASERTTSENYLFWLPMLLARRARLLDNSTLRSQTCALERVISPNTNHETVRHPQTSNAHDDVCASAAGAMVLAGDKTVFRSNYDWVSGPDHPDPQEQQAGDDLFFRGGFVST
jgi:hypothetical protein